MLADVAREAARRFGDKPAYVSPNGWGITYSELDRCSDEVAAGLRRRGIGEGDVIALCLQSTPEYPVAYLAAAKVGAITAGVNPRLGDAERSKVLDVAQPRLVIATADLASVSGGFDVEVVETAASTDAALRPLREDADGFTPVPDDPDRPLAIIFTSGTTGLPKGALFCNRQLAGVTAMDLGDRWGGGGASIAGTSLAHLGFMTKFPGHLRAGGTSYMVRRWRADEALRMIAEHRMTSTGGIPTQVALMLQVPEFDEYDLSSVQVVVFGGGPATPALIREARERFGAPALTRYSCTESASGTGTDPADPPEDAEESVGRPRPGVEVAILDDDDRPVPAGEIGAVCLRSPTVMSGYYLDPAATKAAFTADGFVRTGDLGLVDEKGRLRLAGRSKEMYVRGGYNVYPLEVESVLAAHPAVAAVAVQPRTDPVMGEIGVAVVVPRDGEAPPALDDLRAFGRDRLAAYKLPEDLRIVEALPLTAMEKVDRRALAALVEG